MPFRWMPFFTVVTRTCPGRGWPFSGGSVTLDSTSMYRAGRTLQDG